jgi:hypothetical protein
MEVLHNRTDFGNREAYLHTLGTTAVTDCKSLYDVLKQVQVGNVSDREASLDVLCCRQVIQRLKPQVRWAPGTLNMADILTKDEGACCDLYRSVLRSGEYSIAQEDQVLLRRAGEKERRQLRAQERLLQSGKKANMATVKDDPKDETNEQDQDSGAYSIQFLNAIYGLNEAPRVWNQKIVSKLVGILQNLTGTFDSDELLNTTDSVWAYLVG